VALTDILTPLLQTGVLGLSSLLGSHTSAASTAQTYLMIIEASASNPQVVSDNAELLSAVLGSTDPLSAVLARQIRANAANPALVLQLANQIAQSIVQHNSSIMSNLSSIVAGATSLGNTSLANAASTALLNKAITG
jgi:hypothetical protein